MNMIMMMIVQLCSHVCWSFYYVVRPSRRRTSSTAVVRTLSIALLLFLIVGVTAASDSTTSFRKFQRDSSSLPNYGNVVRKSSYNDSDSDSDDDDDDDHSDEDDDDNEDRDERVRNAIVGAVPAILGLLAIIILCIFMICGRKRTSQRAKWDSRNQELPHIQRSNQSSAVAEVNLEADNDTNWSYDYRTQPTVAVHSPVPSYEECCGPSHECANDSPPSYEEVMRRNN